MTIPNIISLFRLLLSPVLLFLAFFDFEKLFLVILIIAFITDAIDGPIARYMHQETTEGSILDSWADVSVYLAYPLGAWWLWPEVIKREAVFVLLILASVIIPALAGLIKFHRFTNYHTWMVKVAAVTMAISSLVMFIFGPYWPFRIAVIVCVIAAVEEILITMLLKRPRGNIQSLWHAVRKQQ